MTAYASSERRRRFPLASLAGAALRAAASNVGPLAGRRTRAEREAEAGRRIAAELGSLRGVYTKLGQQLAIRADALSDEFRAPFGALADSAPPVPFEQIRAELARALGTAERFAWIDPRPLGTASIAQVHRARLRGGEQVAVKVRHAELTPERVERDLRGLRRVAWLLGPWLGRGDAGELVDELSEALLNEIDFEREGQAAESIARDLADDSRVLVPRVHWEATTRSVLTLDYVARLRIDDRPALEARGVAAEAVLAIVADAYGRQIFGHGLFHADPHAGNLYVVDEPGPEPRVLFIDFGLAQRLSPQLREELRLGMKALLARDVDALLAGLGRSNALLPGREAEARAALAAALDAGAARALGANAAGIQALTGLGKRLLRESRAFRVPRELLLWARTLAHVYALFGRIAPDTDPMRRLLPHLLRFVSEPAATR
ncbi:MAG: AarF/ABC1/UbiB kinase family protein [Deltaproteobacteria bacterium]|nr:AarF/ABC1/UbiB kinase family protein [Deltaproteobacteria bacterium]